MKKVILLASLISLIFNFSFALAQTAKQGAQDGLYVSKEYGFSIQGPRGWFKRLGSVAGKSEVVFTKGFEEKVSFPILGVTVDATPQQIKTALDFAKYIVQEYAKAFEARQSTFTIIEPPHEIEINGLKGARFIFEVAAKNGVTMKNIDCKFMKGELIISVQGMDHSQTFQENLGYFEKAINTFKFIGSGDNLTELKALSQLQPQFTSFDNKSYESLRQQILNSMQTKSSFKTLFIVEDKTRPGVSAKNAGIMEWSMVFVSPGSFEVYQNNLANGEADIWRVVGDKVYIKIGVWAPFPNNVSDPTFKEIFNARKQLYKTLGFEKYLEMIKKEIPVGIANNVQNNYTVIKYRVNKAEDLYTGKAEKGSFTSEFMVWVDNKDYTIRFVKTDIDGKDEGGKEIKKGYEHYFSSYNSTFKLGKPEMPWMKEKK